MRTKSFNYNEWALNISRAEFNKLSNHEKQQVLRARERAEEVAQRKRAKDKILKSESVTLKGAIESINKKILKK